MKKNIVITGASGNLGKASLEKFLEHGHSIIPIVSLGKAGEFNGRKNIEAYEADLTQEKEVEGVINNIIQKNKTIDVALLLVGGFAMGGIQETDGTLVKRMMSLNFDTAYFTARSIFRQMIKQSNGGRIFLVGSRPALDPKAGKDVVAYALSKSLIFTLAQLLNAEGAGKNVVTSVIVPSIIDTPANRKDMPKADFSNWVKPEAIADVMAFLSSTDGETLREPVIKIYGKS
jgi:NAD(P)-dependent dehydrogenase (short-subunit alcohol dehydrogenase family)